MSASPAAASSGPSARPATEASWLTRRMCTVSCGTARATDEGRRARGGAAGCSPAPPSPPPAAPAPAKAALP